jgi:hypothetical protein
MLGEPGAVLERRGGFGEERGGLGPGFLPGSLAFPRTLAIRAWQLERGGEPGREHRRTLGQLAGVAAQRASVGAELLGSAADRSRLGSKTLGLGVACGLDGHDRGVGTS